MTLALLGTGLLGAPLAERLAAAGHAVTVWNRTKAKADALRPAGIAVAAQPAEAVRAAEAVVLVLTDARAIREVLIEGPARAALAGRTVIQMGTIAPADSRTLLQEIQAAGGDYLEAPVLGSIAEAKAGTLLVMVGAEPEQFARWGSLFRCVGPEPRLIGPVGLAAALKLALNQLIASHIAALSLSVGLLQRAGVPVETFMAMLRESALYAPAFDKKLPRLLARDYAAPNFPATHLLKDVDLFRQEAAAAGLNLSSLDGIRGLLEETVRRGLGALDYSALYEAVNPCREPGAAPGPAPGAGGARAATD